MCWRKLTSQAFGDPEQTQIWDLCILITTRKKIITIFSPASDFISSIDYRWLDFTICTMILQPPYAIHLQSKGNSSDQTSSAQSRRNSYTAIKNQYVQWFTRRPAHIPMIFSWIFPWISLELTIVWWLSHENMPLRHWRKNPTCWVQSSQLFAWWNVIKGRAFFKVWGLL